MNPKQLEKVIEELKEPMKVYVVLNKNLPEFVSHSKALAHDWAEGKYGSKSDGICVDGVEVRSFTDDHLLDRP